MIAYSKSFQSSMAKELESWVKSKQEVGFSYVATRKLLLNFDRFLCKKYPSIQIITKDTIDNWLADTKVHQNFIALKLAVIRPFTRYLHSKGITSYIPTRDDYPISQIMFPKYVLNRQEVINFFKVADTIYASKSCKASDLSRYTLPVYFRLLYCTGLRPSEGLLLKVEDLDFETHKAIINDTKVRVVREIILPDDLIEILTRYNQIASAKFPNRRIFFPNSKGNAFIKHIANDWFQKVWAKVPHVSNLLQISPTAYTWRHTFITTRIKLWIEQCIDLNTMMIYLSNYVGHHSIESTAYYFNLTEIVFPTLSMKLRNINAYLFGKQGALYEKSFI